MCIVAKLLEEENWTFHAFFFFTRHPRHNFQWEICETWVWPKIGKGTKHKFYVIFTCKHCSAKISHSG